MTIDAQGLLLRFLVTGLLLVCGQAALADQHTIPLFVSAFTTDAPQGRLRILNSGGESGTVAIQAIDDAGARFGPATFTLNAWAAVEFEPSDFSSGNAAKGLSNGLGIGDGHFRLVLDADFPIRPSAYVRAPDGTGPPSRSVGTFQSLRQWRRPCVIPVHSVLGCDAFSRITSSPSAASPKTLKRATATASDCCCHSSAPKYASRSTACMSKISVLRVSCDGPG